MFVRRAALVALVASASVTLFGCGCDVETAAKDISELATLPVSTKDEQCAAYTKQLEIYQKYDGCETNGVKADYTAFISAATKAKTDAGC